MNALHPPPAPGEIGAQAEVLDPWPDAAGTLRLFCRLSWSYGAVLLLLGVLGATPLWPEARAGGLAGVAAAVMGEKTGEAGIPKSVVTDGPVVTKTNAPGMAWMEKHFLI